MSLTTEPVIFVVGETEASRQWTGLLRARGVYCRSVNSLNELSQDDSVPGCLFLILTSDRDMDGIQACARWLAIGEGRPLLAMASTPDLLRILKRISGPQIEVLDAAMSSDDVIANLRFAARADVENRRRRAAWTEISERFRSLTSKEQEVLDLLLVGMPNKSIAGRLCITERAIEMRRATLMRKLKVQSHAALIQLVTRYDIYSKHGLLLPTD